MNSRIPPIGGLGAGVVVVLAFLLIPRELLESGVDASGIAALIPVAAPPLGFTARILLALAGGIGVGAVTWAALYLLFGAGGPFAGKASTLVRGDQPVVRRADAHPDAPPRWPLSAAELPVPTVATVGDMRDDDDGETVATRPDADEAAAAPGGARRVTVTPHPAPVETPVDDDARADDEPPTVETAFGEPVDRVAPEPVAPEPVLAGPVLAEPVVAVPESVEVADADDFDPYPLAPPDPVAPIPDAPISTAPMPEAPAPVEATRAAPPPADLPADLDVPLAPFDPGAVLPVPHEPVRTLKPLAPALAPGERLDTFPLAPPPPSPAAETDDAPPSIDALLRRLEQGAARLNETRR